MVRRAVEYAKCGIFDGIFFDTWRDDYRDRKYAHYYAYDLHEAAITLLRRIREGVDPVRDNLLIIVNTNDNQNTAFSTLRQWDVHGNYRALSSSTPY